MFSRALHDARRSAKKNWRDGMDTSQATGFTPRRVLVDRDQTTVLATREFSGQRAGSRSCEQRYVPVPIAHVKKPPTVSLYRTVSTG